jgi:hypothetical protein
VLTHAERKTSAKNRGARSQESSISNLADMEFVFRVKLDVRHRFIFRCIEGRHLRFRRAEFPQVAAGVGQAEVVGVGPKLIIIIRRKFPFYKEEQAVLSVGSCLQSEWHLKQVQGALL